MGTIMNEQWFYLVGEEQQGPVSVEQIQQFASTGIITGETMVWKEGMAEWLPAGSVGAIALPVPASSPQVSPQPASVLQAGSVTSSAASLAPQSVRPRTSGMALGSLILGVVSIPLIFVCIGWISALAALVMSIVALTRIPGRAGELKGKGLAYGGLVTSILSMVIYGAFLVLFVKNRGLSESEAQGLGRAETLIISDSRGVAHGNTAQAEQLAAKFSTSIDSLQKEFFVREGDEPHIQLSGGKFITFCQLGEDSGVFLVHVPELRKYKDGAKESMVELAWMVANEVSVDQISSLEKGDDLLVGVRGTFLYADIVQGKVGDAEPTAKGLKSSVLNPYFEPVVEEEDASTQIEVKGSSQ